MLWDDPENLFALIWSETRESKENRRAKVKENRHRNAHGKLTEKHEGTKEKQQETKETRQEKGQEQRQETKEHLQENDRKLREIYT